MHEIEIVDVTYTPEFFNDFWGTLDRLRNDKIRLLRYQYKQLPWTSVAMIAPAEYCITAVDPNHYSLCCQADWYRREDSEETYKSILREFRKLGLRKQDFPDQWVGIYANWDRFMRPRANSLFYKSSMVFPTSIEEKVLGLIHKINTGLGESGLHPVPDGFDESGDLLPSQEGYVDFVIQNPWKLVLSGTGFRSKFHAASQAELLELTLRKLISVVGALENGHQIPFPIDPWSARKIFPMFGRFRIFSDSEYFFDQVKEDLCDSYRSRLVRLLRRPEMWRNMQVTIDRCKRSLEKCPYKSAVPYDIVAELEAYQEEVVAAFPWLLENPFSSVGVACERPRATGI